MSICSGNLISFAENFGSLFNRVVLSVISQFVPPGPWLINNISIFFSDLQTLSEIIGIHYRLARISTKLVKPFKIAKNYYQKCVNLGVNTYSNIK